MQESLSASTSAASAAAESAAAALPEPVRDALSTIKGPLGEAFTQVNPAPICSQRLLLRFLVLYHGSSLSVLHDQLKGILALHWVR